MKARLITIILFLTTTIPALFPQTINPDSIAKYTDLLYSSMNIADKANFPRSFWERNVASALEAKRDMPWGAKIPAREWLHFVLPVRVNNETPDSSRMVFYREIAPRVRNLSMEQAALEVNHWAHEKATYRPSDERTSSPLATVRTTFGRCGEESTLVVAAMRSVGIPARQIYTPRWAHTDDNHAWVEVWIDGRWRFLGACEPEPVLDLGWFNEPASQGVLMATNVIGNYDGPEQKLYRDSCYTRINITDNYARTRRASVVVVDSAGNAVADAPVSFRVYNYAELYPLFSTPTDADGKAELQCGYGDVVAWATSPDGEYYGFAEIEASATEPVWLTLGRDALARPVELLLNPPKPSPLKPDVTPAQTASNDMRKAYEDSIRNATMSRFLSADKTSELVASWGDDAPMMAKILTESYGNYATMSRFAGAVPPARRHEARVWLENLREKDWRDIAWPVMEDFFLNRSVSVNPRIANEELTTWLTDFDKHIPAGLRDSLSVSPAAVERWIERNIRIDNEHNPNQFCMAPASVWNTRTADSHSRDIFYVALSRWLGFDAKIDPVTSGVFARKNADEEYYRAFASVDEPTKNVRVRLTYANDTILVNPKYYRHFTISRIENGIPKLLNYPENADWRSTFADGVDLQPGKYLLTSGRRLADGSVKACLAEFSVKADDDVVDVPLIVPNEPNQVSVIGSFNADPLLPLTGRGMFVAAFVKRNHEPSSHFINELCDNNRQVEQMGRPVVLIVSTEDDAKALSELKSLPGNVVITTNAGFNWLKDLSEEFEQQLDAEKLPIVLVADSFNRVMHLHKGYRPGYVDSLFELITSIPK